MPADTAVVDVPTTSTSASPAPSSAPSAPSTASATPATTAAAPASPAGERLSPNSTRKEISDFLRRVDAPDASATSTPVAQPGAATTAQAQDGLKPGEVAPKVEPPKETWPTILENARTKAANDLRTQYGITPQITPQVFQSGLGFARAIHENPIEFINKLASEISNHPIWGPQLRSSAGRTLAAAPAARPEPDVQVMNAQGQVVGMTYSAERQQQVNEWDWAQREAKLNQRLQPLISAHEQQQQDVQVAAFQKEVGAAADSELTRVNEILEGNTALGPKVAELMAQGVNHIDAALQVRKQFIVPNATKAAEAAVLDANLRKVAGNTVSGSSSHTPKNTIGPNSTQKELAAFLRAQAEGTA